MTPLIIPPDIDVDAYLGSVERYIVYISQSENILKNRPHAEQLLWDLAISISRCRDSIIKGDKS